MLFHILTVCKYEVISKAVVRLCAFKQMRWFSYWGPKYTKVKETNDAAYSAFSHPVKAILHNKACCTSMAHFFM